MPFSPLAFRRLACYNEENLKRKDFSTMNKTELIDAVAAKASLNKKEASAAVAAVIDTITDALVNGDKVQIIGFGTFEVKKVAAKEGRNPKTGESIQIAACNRPAFSSGAALKNAVNK